MLIILIMFCISVFVYKDNLYIYIGFFDHFPFMMDSLTWFGLIRFLNSHPLWSWLPIINLYKKSKKNNILLVRRCSGFFLKQQLYNICDYDISFPFFKLFSIGIPHLNKNGRGVMKSFICMKIFLS